MSDEDQRKPTAAETAFALGNMLAREPDSFSLEEMTAMLNKLPADTHQLVVQPLLHKLLELAQPRRIEAERDGWKQIAHTLLRAAFGEDVAEYSIPPLELLALVDVKFDALRNPQSVGEVRKLVPALAQWWANLTMQDSERRAKREHWRLKQAVVAASQMLRNAERQRARSEVIATFRERWRTVVDELNRATEEEGSTAA
jgi:hypothetical protein